MHLVLIYIFNTLVDVIYLVHCCSQGHIASFSTICGPGWLWFTHILKTACMTSMHWPHEHFQLLSFLFLWCSQAVSPDGEAIVTGAGDETLRFWNVFNKARSHKVSFPAVNMLLCLKGAMPWLAPKCPIINPVIKPSDVIGHCQQMQSVKWTNRNAKSAGCSFRALIRRHLWCHWPIITNAERQMNQSECQVSRLNFPTLWFKDIFVAKRGKSQLFLFTGPLINRKSDTILYSFTSDLKWHIFPYSTSPYFNLSKLNNFLYFLQQESKSELNLFSRIR